MRLNSTLLSAQQIYILNPEDKNWERQDKNREEKKVERESEIKTERKKERKNKKPTSSPGHLWHSYVGGPETSNQMVRVD